MRSLRPSWALTLGVLATKISTALATQRPRDLALERRLDTPESIAEQQNNDPSRKWCTIFRKAFVYSANGQTGTEWGPYNWNVGADECEDACGGPPPANSNKTHSWTCGWPGGANYQWVPMQTSNPNEQIQNATAPCLCDDSFIDELVDDFVAALPAIAEVACYVWVGALTGFVDYFIDAGIDTVESLMDKVRVMGGLSTANKNVISGARLFNQTYSTLEEGRDAFGRWMGSKLCNQGYLTSDQINSIYGAVNDAYSVIVTAATLPTGAGDIAEVFAGSAGLRWTRGLDPPESIFPRTEPPAGAKPIPDKPPPVEHPEDPEYPLSNPTNNIGKVTSVIDKVTSEIGVATSIADRVSSAVSVVTSFVSQLSNDVQLSTSSTATPSVVHAEELSTTTAMTTSAPAISSFVTSPSPATVDSGNAATTAPPAGVTLYAAPESDGFVVNDWQD